MSVNLPFGVSQSVLRSLRQIAKGPSIRQVVIPAQARRLAWGEGNPGACLGYPAWIPVSCGDSESFRRNDMNGYANLCNQALALQHPVHGSLGSEADILGDLHLRRHVLQTPQDLLQRN